MQSTNKFPAVPTKRGRTVATFLGVLALGIIMGASAMADNGSLDGGQDVTQVSTPMAPASAPEQPATVTEPEPITAPVVVEPSPEPAAVKAKPAEPVAAPPVVERKTHTSRTAPEPVAADEPAVAAAVVEAPAAPAPAPLVPHTETPRQGFQGEDEAAQPAVPTS